MENHQLTIVLLVPVSFVSTDSLAEVAGSGSGSGGGVGGLSGRGVAPYFSSRLYTETETSQQRAANTSQTDRDIC